MNSNDFLKEGIGEDAQAMALDHEVQMARQECYHAAEDAITLHKLLRHMSEQQGLEGWVSAKITLAADYLNTVREHLEYQLMSGAEQSAPISVVTVAEGTITQEDLAPVTEAPVTKKPQPYNKDWVKELPKEKLDKLAGPRYKKDKKEQSVEEGTVYDLEKEYGYEKPASKPRRSAPSDYPYSQAEDDAYFREIFRKKREAAKKAEQDKQQGVAEGSLNEFAPVSGPGGDNYEDDLHDILMVYIMRNEPGLINHFGKDEVDSVVANMVTMGTFTNIDPDNKGDLADALDKIIDILNDDLPNPPGVAEGEEMGTFAALKDWQVWDVHVFNNFYRGKYADYGPRLYSVVAGSPEEARQVIINNADYVLQDLLSRKLQNGKKVLPRGSALPIEDKRVGKAQPGTITTMGLKKMLTPDGVQSFKFTGGKIVDGAHVAGGEQVAEKRTCGISQGISEMSAGSVAGVVNPTPKNKAKVGSLFGGTYKQKKAAK